MDELTRAPRASDRVLPADDADRVVDNRLGTRPNRYDDRLPGRAAVGSLVDRRMSLTRCAFDPVVDCTAAQWEGQWEGQWGRRMAAEPLARFRVARTSDLDEAQDAMQSTFLPLRMRLLEPFRSQNVDLRLNAAHVGELTVSYVRFGSDLQLATAEAENYHVNLPISGGAYSRSGRLEHVQSTPQRAAVFMPGLPADIDWPRACAQFCLMFPRRVLQQELEAMLDRSLSEPIVFAPAMEVTSGAGRAWLDVLRLIEAQAGYRTAC
jgi:hypothetical protein